MGHSTPPVPPAPPRCLCSAPSPCPPPAGPVPLRPPRPLHRLISRCQERCLPISTEGPQLSSEGPRMEEGRGAGWRASGEKQVLGEGRQGPPLASEQAGWLEAALGLSTPCPALKSGDQPHVTFRTAQEVRAVTVPFRRYRSCGPETQGGTCEPRRLGPGTWWAGLPLLHPPCQAWLWAGLSPGGGWDEGGPG